MKRKFLTIGGAVLAFALSATALFGCNSEKKPQFDAEETIKGFTSAPVSGSVTYKSKFELKVNSDNPGFQAFAKDIDDTVSIDYDLSAGNVYLYAKKTTKAGEVSEQLLIKEDGNYVLYSTSNPTVKIENESAAIETVKSSMNAFSRTTAGYVDTDAFLFTGQSWVQKYILLGSENIEAKGSSFKYDYSETSDGGIKLDLNASYIGYYGDMGVFEFGIDETHTGSNVSVTTTKEGHITAFTQSFNNHLEMPIVNPPIPLDLTGSRSFTATYGSIEKKNSIERDQIRFGKDTGVKSVTCYDFVYGNFATLAVPATKISENNFLAMKVEVNDGLEVDQVIVNGVPATNMNGYYCHMTPCASGTSFDVVITTKEAQKEVEGEGATITVGSVSGATVKTYDFNYGAFEGNFMAAAKEGTEVVPGHFAAFMVTAPEGKEIKSVQVNGEDCTSFGGGVYCYMAAVKGGETFTVTVTVE